MDNDTTDIGMKRLIPDYRPTREEVLERDLGDAIYQRDAARGQAEFWRGVVMFLVAIMVLGVALVVAL